MEIKVKKLIDAYDKYIELLNEELKELISVAIVRGWQSTRVEAGKHARSKIEALKEKINEDKETNKMECK